MLTFAPIRVGALARRARALTTAGAAAAFARRGPLYGRLQRSGAAMPSDDEWAFHGAAIAEELGAPRSLAADALPPQLAARIYHLCLPIYFFARHLARSPRDGGAPPLIGLSAPQGCGKTTLVDSLTGRFAADGLECAAVSFDDFYLRGDAQDALAAENRANAMLQVRGNAGTHDLDLGSATLRALAAPRCGSGGAWEPVAIPRYDKAARGGRGDRSPAASWPLQRRRPDVVLLEGWMAGFEPLPEGDELLASHPGVPQVSELLRDYAAWHRIASAWVVLAIDEPRWVFDWRLEAERAMAAAGRPGMSDAEVADFVSRYQPAYTAFLPALYAAAEAGGVGGKPTLLVRVDKTRGPAAE